MRWWPIAKACKLSKCGPCTDAYLCFLTALSKQVPFRSTRDICFLKMQIEKNTDTRSFMFQKYPENSTFEVFSLNCYFTFTRLTWGHSQGDIFTNPMLPQRFLQLRVKGHREPPNEFGSPRPAVIYS